MDKCIKCNSSKIYANEDKGFARCLNCGYTWNIDKKNSLSSIDNRILEETKYFENNKSKKRSIENSLKKKGYFYFCILFLLTFFSVLFFVFVLVDRHLIRYKIHLLILPIVLFIVSLFVVVYFFVEKKNKFAFIESSKWSLFIFVPLLFSIASSSISLGYFVNNNYYGFTNGFYYSQPHMDYITWEYNILPIEKVVDKNIVIPEVIDNMNIEKIEFKNDSQKNVETITLGKKLKTFTLTNDINLKNVDFKDDSDLLDFYLQNCGYYTSGFKINMSNLTKIKSFKFSSCDISEISYPTNWYEIKNQTFIKCLFVNSEYRIPRTIDKIESYAFDRCNVEKIYIPSSVQTIEYAGFDKCIGLTDIYCEAPSKPSGWNESWFSYGETYPTVHWGCSI